MQTVSNIDTALLPGSLSEIINSIGLPAALKMVDRFGGIEIWVPSQPVSNDHPLIDVIGRQAADALVQTFALNRLPIPKASRFTNAVRNAEIRARRGKQTVHELAQEFNLTERRIWQIFNT